MFQVIATAFDLVLLLLQSLFKLAYVLGHFLTVISKYVTSFLFVFLKVLRETSTIFLADFGIFYEDVAQLCGLLLFTGYDAILNIANIVINCLHLAISLLLAISNNSATTLYSTYQDLVTSFCVLAETLKKIVIIVGDSCWLLVTLLPNILLFLAKFVILLVRKCLETIKSFASELIEDIWTVLYKSAMFCVDVPLQSFLGCILIGVLVYYRHKSLDVAQQIVRTALRPLRHLVLSSATSGWATIKVNCRQYAGRCYRSVTTSKAKEKPHWSNKKTTAPNDKNLCVICQDRDKCVVLLPCRHLCICDICANKLIRLNQYECPLCRVPLGTHINVYT